MMDEVLFLMTETPDSPLQNRRTALTSSNLLVGRRLSVCFVCRVSHDARKESSRIKVNTATGRFRFREREKLPVVSVLPPFQRSVNGLLSFVRTSHLT